MLVAFGMIFKKSEFPFRQFSKELSSLDLSEHSWVVVLKESLVTLNNIVQPIGITSMNANHIGFVEHFANALSQDLVNFPIRPDWILIQT